MSEVNIPLLRKAVEWAEVEAAKPWELSEWYQKDWATKPETLILQTRNSLGRFVKGGKRIVKAEECGTCYCIAGWVAAETQDSPVTAGIFGGFVRVTADGTSEHASTVAARELGLSSEQANKLFAPHNTIKDVRRIAENIAGERL